MDVRTLALSALAGLFISITFIGTSAAADRPYAEGPVSDVTSIRTEPGMFDDYMAWVAGTWKREMEELKKAGIVLGYAVYATTPRTVDDPDLYLVVTYKNMAALDNLLERTDPIYERIEGNLAAQNAAFAARGKLRTILGDEYIRELNLK